MTGAELRERALARHRFSLRSTQSRASRDRTPPGEFSPSSMSALADVFIAEFRSLVTVRIVCFQSSAFSFFSKIATLSQIYITLVINKSMARGLPIGLVEGNPNENPPDGTRSLTKKEVKTAGQIAMSMVKAGERGAFLHEFTTECINAYDLPGYPPNSKGRLAIFNVLLELAEHIVRQEPPPEPNSHAFMRRVVNWTGEQ